MENFNFTDEEQKTFAELFANLDRDKQAKLSFKNVNHFLSVYQLTDNDLEKVNDDDQCVCILKINSVYFCPLMFSNRYSTCAVRSD